MIIYSLDGVLLQIDEDSWIVLDVNVIGKIVI